MGEVLLTSCSLVSVFPAGINVGATWDKKLAYERGKAMGVENRAKGITVLLGPVAGGLGRVSFADRVISSAFILTRALVVP